MWYTPGRIMNIYVDESGELGTDPRSSRHYVIAALSVERAKPLSNVIRKLNGSLIRNGWPRDVETKATNLFNAPKNPKIPDTFKYKRDATTPLFRVIDRISRKADHIDIAIVRKDRLYSQLRDLPFGVLHNYYCGLILIPAILECSKAEVFVDRRSKERHSLRHFDGYIMTKVWERAFEGAEPIDLRIQHVESHMVHGIAAADYLAWAVFRQLESDDGRFLRAFRSRIRKWTGLY